MTKRLTLASVALMALSAFLATALLMAGPALATGKAPVPSAAGPEVARDHDGDSDSNSASAFTEDDDSNDGDTANNVPDDGDNAHPSGKDRSVESGGSGNQGGSESNPDDSKGPMRYEGIRGDDKANGPGGTDLADQDGNNGCGNDDDFNDDNNGRCSGKPADSPDEDEVVEDEDEIITDDDDDEVIEDNDEVIPGTDDDDDEVLPGTDVDPSSPQDRVLGDVITRSPGGAVAPAAVAPAVVTTQGNVLPTTGTSVLALIVLALALMTTGAAVLKVVRPETVMVRR